MDLHLTERLEKVFKASRNVAIINVTSDEVTYFITKVVFEFGKEPPLLIIELGTLTFLF